MGMIIKKISEIFIHKMNTQMEQNTQGTALLVMDMQVAILGNFAGAAELINKVAKAIAVARDKKIPVVYITVGFRAGTPEISRNNKSFTTARERFTATSMDEFTKIHSTLVPLAGEIIIVKRRVSAFTGSDL